jgi:hypothetical protein
LAHLSYRVPELRGRHAVENQRVLLFVKELHCLQQLAVAVPPLHRPRCDDRFLAGQGQGAEHRVLLLGTYPLPRCRRSGTRQVRLGALHLNRLVHLHHQAPDLLVGYWRPVGALFLAGLYEGRTTKHERGPLVRKTATGKGAGQLKTLHLTLPAGPNDEAAPLRQDGPPIDADLGRDARIAVVADQ